MDFTAMDFATLVPRKLFGGDGSSHQINHTCPVPDESGPAIVPLDGSFTFHRINMIVSGAMTGFASLIALALIFMHATHCSVPAEQKQVIRISSAIPIFSIISFVIIVAQSKWVYLSPLVDLYESMALAAFFLLLGSYVAPEEGERQRKLAGIGKLGLYNRAWFMVFQQPVVLLLVLIITAITEATNKYCATSNKVQFAHVWLAALTALSSAVAIMSILRFYSATKKMTHEQKPLLKLIAFKLMIFLQVVQNLIFSYLTSSGHLHANNHLTFLDLSVGLKQLIICAEMVLFAILFPIAYPITPYLLRNNPAAGDGVYHGGFLGLKAILYACNPLDLLFGIIRAPSMFGRRADVPGKVESDGSRAPMGRNGGGYGYDV